MQLRVIISHQIQLLKQFPSRPHKKKKKKKAVLVSRLVFDSLSLDFTPLLLVAPAMAVQFPRYIGMFSFHIVLSKSNLQIFC